jgi:hypothetical protein
MPAAKINELVESRSNSRVPRSGSVAAFCRAINLIWGKLAKLDFAMRANREFERSDEKIKPSPLGGIKFFHCNFCLRVTIATPGAVGSTFASIPKSSSFAAKRTKS